jgi:hypothetical protein
MSGIGDIISTAADRFVSVLKDAAASIVSRVLGAFGLTMVTMKSLLPDLKSYAAQYWNAVPAEGMKWLSLLGVDVLIVAVFSALVIKMTWKVFFLPKSVASSMGIGS